MKKNEIIKLSKKNIDVENLEKAKKTLEKNYEISYGRYEPEELKKAITEESPFFIENNFITGFHPGTNIFYNDNDEKVPIERMVKAVIVEDTIEDLPEKEEHEEIADNRDPFVIMGRNEWEGPLSDFSAIIMPLNVGEVFLPPHSAIFNFMKQSDEQKKEKIVSMLDGVNINIYSSENYIDNAIHEIGHLFWRDCLNYEEKKAFDNHFKNLRPSALYEYEWERSDAEEVFCTIYKWYVKSILISKAFYNILEFEDSRALDLIQNVFKRISNDKITSDTWDLSKNDVMAYLNPPIDRATGNRIMKKGLFDEIKDVEIPSNLLRNVDRFEGGKVFIDLEKAIVPVDGNKIDFYSKMEKAVSDKKTVFLDMDGVIADFVKGYKTLFNRDAYKDDPFTVKQFCSTDPNFFRKLPVKDDGLELFNRLKNDYNIIFLTTPMEGMEECKMDKILWIRENIGDYDVFFSSNKEEFAQDEQSILIDDMDYNLEPWTEAGGIAIKFHNNKSNNLDKIISKIESVFNPEEETIRIKNQLKNMVVNTSPTESQKKTGIYKKGKVNIKGLDIRVENPKGSIRFGFDENGKKWLNRMKSHYGYIVGTEGNDLDPVDCFIGSNPNKSLAFVVNQGKNGLFDEVKIMLGFDDIDSARQAYLNNYEKGWEKNILSIKQTNTKKLRDWLKSGKMTEPYN